MPHRATSYTYLPETYLGGRGPGASGTLTFPGTPDQLNSNNNSKKEVINKQCLARGVVPVKFCLGHKMSVICLYFFDFGLKFNVLFLLSIEIQKLKLDLKVSKFLKINKTP